MAASKTKEYSVADVYKETARMLREEMVGFKKAPLNKAEQIKMEKLAKLLSNNVLKEMKIV